GRQFVVRQQRRRSAAEIHRLVALVAVLRRIMLQLHVQRLEERCVRLLRRHEIEVTVRATLSAEWDVEVQACHAEGERSQKMMPARNGSARLTASSPTINAGLIS